MLLAINLLLFFFRRRKRFRAEVKVKYHHDSDVSVNRREQLNVGDCSSNVHADEIVHDVNNIAVSDFQCEDEGDEQETSSTSHYRRLQRSEDAWSKLREGSLAITFQSQGSFFKEEICHFCDSTVGICRCFDCSATLSSQGGYSGFQVTGMIEGFFWV